MKISPPRHHKILIVDDQQKNIQVLGSLLRQEDYIIGVATNGKQALDILIQSNDYDLVLLDVNMPIMNGFEACKAIRQQEHLKDIPIIFLTALVEKEDNVTGLEVGGQDYITKPFNSSELLARVKTHIELKHSKDQLKQVNFWLEEKVAERTNELETANNKLLKLDSAKSEFLKIISHEILTPLNGIIGGLSVINEFKLPEEVCEMINILDLSANRLEEFSAKALNISELNIKGKDALKLIPIDIHGILNSQINILKANADKKNIDITLSNESNKTITFLDEKHITNCFFHIIDNAIKYGNSDSEIKIRIIELQDNFIISVEDEGIGFNEDFNISTIQPFNTNNHVDRNPGLSLFLCKQIIEAHDGKIEAHNIENGVKIVVFLPKLQQNNI